MAALAQEVARSTPELKAAFEQGLENILSAEGGDRKEAIFLDSGDDRWRSTGSRRAGSATLRRNP